MSRARVIALGLFAFAGTLFPALLLSSQVHSGATGAARLVPDLMFLAAGAGLIGVVLTFRGAYVPGVAWMSTALVAVLILCVMLNFVMFLFIPGLALWGVAIIEALRYRSARAREAGRA